MRTLEKISLRVAITFSALAAAALILSRCTGGFGTDG